MPQPVRPSSTVSTSDWTLVGGAAHAVLADDLTTTYLESPNSTNSAVEVGFSAADAVFPVIGTVNVRVLARKTAAGGNTRSLTIAMVSGGNVVASGTMPLTEVYGWGVLSIPNVVAYSEPAPSTVRLTSGGQTGGQAGNRRGVQVAAIEVTYPDLAYVCDGQGDVNGDHCCYVNGEVCIHFVENDPVSGRRYACGLFLELKNWDLVHQDPRYLAYPKPTWDAAGVVDCGYYWGPNREVQVALGNKANLDLADIDYGMCCFKRKLRDDPKPTVPEQVRRRVERLTKGQAQRND